MRLSWNRLEKALHQAVSRHGTYSRQRSDWSSRGLIKDVVCFDLYLNMA